MLRHTLNQWHAHCAVALRMRVGWLHAYADCAPQLSTTSPWRHMHACALAAMPHYPMAMHRVARPGRIN